MCNSRCRKFSQLNFVAMTIKADGKTRKKSVVTFKSVIEGLGYEANLRLGKINEDKGERKRISEGTTNLNQISDIKRCYIQEL